MTGGDAVGVVLVEEEELRLTAQELLLEGLGFDVVAGRTADEVIGRIRAANFQPRAIVTDFLLGGGLTALEVANRIKIQVGYVVPVVIVTADTRPQRRREAEGWGWTVLHEPVAPDALEAAILRAARRPAAR